MFGEGHAFDMNFYKDTIFWFIFVEIKMKTTRQPMTWSIGDHGVVSRIIASYGLMRTTTWSIGDHGAEIVYYYPLTF